MDNRMNKLVRALSGQRGYSPAYGGARSVIGQSNSVNSPWGTGGFFSSPITFDPFAQGQGASFATPSQSGVPWRGDPNPAVSPPQPDPTTTTTGTTDGTPNPSAAAGLPQYVSDPSNPPPNVYIGSPGGAGGTQGGNPGSAPSAGGGFISNGGNLNYGSPQMSLLYHLMSSRLF